MKEEVNFDMIENFKRAIAVNFQYIFIGVMIIMFATVNLSVISYFWISDRIYEIGIKKAFGITDKQISLDLYSEVIAITFFASFLSLITQYILSNLDNSYLSNNINLSVFNTLIIIIINIILAGCISFGQVIRVIKVQPIETIKR